MKTFIRFAILALTLLCLTGARWRVWKQAAGHATAPAFVAQAAADSESGASQAVTISISAGNTVVIVVGCYAQTVSSVTGGGTYTRLGYKDNAEQGSFRTEAWGVLSATATSSVTVNFAGTPAFGISVAVLRYTGVNAFGNVVTAGNASGVYGDTTHSVTVTMQDANNRVVHGGALRSPATGTATVGTLRVNHPESNEGSLGLCVGDNTAAAAGALAMTYTSPTGQLWNSIGVELRSNP